MDRCQRIDMRASAFSVPPQQFITYDGGIVELGVEIQFGITDPIAMVKEVADHQDILRLGLIHKYHYQKWGKGYHMKVTISGSQEEVLTLVIWT